MASSAHLLPGRPTLITLTTDFGTRDSYVAEMKGVLLSTGPSALQLVDLSHELPPQDVAHAARFLEAAVPRFPHGTIHLVVIDPGVGSTRQALIASVGGQTLVLPDNGLISGLLSQPLHCVAIDPAKLGHVPASSTFHGRDVFAPVAAQLANGARPEDFGPPLAHPVALPRPRPIRRDAELVGALVYKDHFGNLASNITRADLQTLGQPLDTLQVRCGAFIGPIRDHYAQVPSGQPLAVLDSQGRLEIAVRNGNAALALHLALQTPVTVQRL